MATTQYLVQPQRRVDGVWQHEPNNSRATRFATLQVKKFTSRGKTMTATRVMSSWATIAQAQAAADTLNRQAGKQKWARPTIGGRWPKTPDRKVYARSLTEDEYHNLKKGH